MRRQLAVAEAAQDSAARSLDDIHEPTPVEMVAQRPAEATEQQFEKFRAADAAALDGMQQSNFDLRRAPDDTRAARRWRCAVRSVLFSPRRQPAAAAASAAAACGFSNQPSRGA